MLTQTSESALTGAVQDVLEQMCFVSLVSETEVRLGSDPDTSLLLPQWQGKPERALGKQVAFSGTLCGVLHFWFERSLADALAANLLGAEIAEMGMKDVSDSLGEIANMVCGAMLGTLEPRQSFAIRVPIDAGDPAMSAGVLCLFHTEEGLLLSSLTFGDGGQ